MKRIQMKNFLSAILLAFAACSADASNSATAESPKGESEESGVLVKLKILIGDKNSWDFTRLGKIDNVDKARLRQILGCGDVTVTFSVK